MAAAVEDEDSDVLRGAIRELRRCTGVPVAFGGLETGGAARLSEFVGTRTAALVGLKIRRGAGLGGRVLTTGRPDSVDDYRVDRRITHDYDRHVAAEGLRAVLAVPIVAEGAFRGVLYGGVRQPQPIGERVVRLAMVAAADAGRELAIRAEVRRRVRDAQAQQRAAASGGRLGSSELEQVRAAHAQLRSLATAIGDDNLKARLAEVAGLLARAVAAEAAPAACQPARPPLSARELDVLAHVALGCTNAEAGAELGLAAETVKAYLRSASRKLGAGSRFEAVVAARAAGLLP